MDKIDHYLLMLGSYEDDFDTMSSKIVQLNDSFEIEGRIRQRFSRIDPHAGGFRSYQHPLYATVTNNVGLEQMAEKICTIQWNAPKELRLGHSSMGMDHFNFYDLDGLKELAGIEDEPIEEVEIVEDEDVHD